VWTGSTQTTDEITFWSPGGKKLGTWALSWSGTQLIATMTTSEYYFAGRLIKNGEGYLASDQLGSIGKFYPYGQEKPSATTNGTEKFTGYLRDSETGNDYAINRYHQPGMGRFLTVDPKRKSALPAIPGSWNRYAYVLGDPINSRDPHGLNELESDACGDDGDDGGDGGDGGGSGGGCDSSGTLNALGENAGECAPPPPPPPPAPTPCNDDIQMYTRPVLIASAIIGGIITNLTIPTHQYLEITSSSGQLLDTVEGLPNPVVMPGTTLLVANVDTPTGCIAPAGTCEHSPGGTGTSENNPVTNNSFQPQILVSCALANAVVATAESFNPVPYVGTAGWRGANSPTGANSNTFMNWLLNMTGLSLFYPVPPSGAIGWYNSIGGGN
jgi:RHS repeat-associated protein